jgi:class 3 adenylate cyclase
MDMAPWQAAGLYDPDAPDAPERAALLEYLADIGLSVDDVSLAATEGRLDRLAADHLLWHDAGAMLDLNDVAELSGLDIDLVRGIARASGTPAAPDETIFRSPHVELFRSFAIGAEIFGEEAILQFTRVLGSAATRVAEAAVSLFSANVSPRLRKDDADPLETVRASAEAVRAFAVVPSAMDVLLREHFLTAIRRSGLLDVVEGGATPVTIGFVDLVESTAAVHAVTPAQWSDAVAAFETTALEAAIEYDCRVVKLIGDEVMLSGATASQVIAVAAWVVDAAGRDARLGSARAGVASGYAVARDGDYFGMTVNLAARLVKLAPPGDILVNDEASTALAESGQAVEPIGEFALKGFGAAVPAFRLRQ